MQKAMFSGETFRKIIITVLILSMIMTFGTAFVSPESSSLREIDPYYFDSDMLSRLDDSQMHFAFDMESQLVSDLSMERNELSELSEAELEEWHRNFDQAHLIALRAEKKSKI